MTQKGSQRQFLYKSKRGGASFVTMQDHFIKNEVPYFFTMNFFRDAILAVDFVRTNCASPPPCEGNFDTDGDVDGSDLAVFAADFGRTDCP